MRDVTSASTVFEQISQTRWEWRSPDRLSVAVIKEKTGLFFPIIVHQATWRKEFSATTSLQAAADVLVEQLDSLVFPTDTRAPFII